METRFDSIFGNDNERELSALYSTLGLSQREMTTNAEVLQAYVGKAKSGFLLQASVALLKIIKTRQVFSL